jgi:hypothetical protein
MASAQRTGALSAFNVEYRRRRLAAAAARQAEARLRKALAGMAAGNVPPSIIARVFDDRRLEPQ